ncbi:response regulator transcription factor [Agromyces intestinalis]|uniref:Response regulator transcription factor n=2 Tax=Agromyces intestinalis TaxID=2592652 RepID=A0A5C1YMK9_9MICO|nr:response regulator transcription factor [Agromyces intestinalis]
MPPESDELLVASIGHARLAIAADDHEGAARVLEVLRPYADLHVAGPATTPYGGPVSLSLAGLARLLGDEEAAVHWASDAVARAEAFGAPWYAATARGLLRELRRVPDVSESSPLGSPASLAPLSPRETEVARHIADGASNRAIADALYLSERTVEQHVRSILRKLELPNRAAVAAWVTRAGG